METVNTPVISPICKGNFNFKKPGINTFPKAIATPINAVPTNKKNGVPSERIIMPTASNRIARNSVISIPKRLATFGAKGETMANASSGIVVINPASILEMSNPSRIYEIIGPTAVSGARMVAEIKIIPIINRVIFLLFVSGLVNK